MNGYQLTRTYVELFLDRLARRVRRDERGEIDEKIIVVGAAVVGAAVVAAIIWGKLTDGANNIDTPSP
jgi:hypothetical protein